MKRLLALLLTLLLAVACLPALAEGEPLPAPTTAAQGTLGYTMKYDAERFTFIPAQSAESPVDVFLWNGQMDGYPNVFLCLSTLAGLAPEEAMAGLKLQAGRDGDNGTVTVAGQTCASFCYAEGTAYNSRMCTYVCVPSGADTLLIEMDWFVEAQEGVSPRMYAMLETFAFAK